MMRTKKSLINIAVGFITYAVIMLGQFYTQKLFYATFGQVFNGIDGYFTQAVAGLAIVELGLGFGIVYKLYKPIAEKNWDQVAVILKFLRNAYLVIAGIMLVLGVAVSFIVAGLIKEDFSKIWLNQIFMLYVLDVIVSYLFAHRRSMFIADQNTYFNNTIHTFIQIFLFVIQILVLNIFKSFEGFLVCKIVCRLLENLIIGYMFKKKYGFINLKIESKMPSIERKDLFKNMNALLFHRVSSFIVLSGSNFIITRFIGLKEGGVWKNYYLITLALHTITNEFFNGILASFGNLLTTENKDKIYSNFNVIYLLNFFVYSYITVSFFNIVSPFVGVWLEDASAVYGIAATIAISSYVYIYGMKQSITMAKMSAGIYNEDKYAAVLGVVVSLIISLVLVKSLGITGVMIGNVLGVILVPQWVQPKLVYNMVFKRNSKSYQYKFILYTLLTSFYTYLAYLVCSRVQLSNVILQVAVNFAVCLVIPNVLNILLFCKTQEFKELWAITKGFIRNMKGARAA